MECVGFGSIQRVLEPLHDRKVGQGACQAWAAASYMRQAFDPLNLPLGCEIIPKPMADAWVQDTHRVVTLTWNTTSPRASGSASRYSCSPVACLQIPLSFN